MNLLWKSLFCGQVESTGAKAQLGGSFVCGRRQRDALQCDPHRV